jgi:hypothetical protein
VRDEVAAVLTAAGRPGHTIAADTQALDLLLVVSAYANDPNLRADPFYVRLLAEDIAAGVITIAYLADQPRGLEAYLDRWWQDIRVLSAFW